MVSRVSWQKITLKLRNPFRLSYGTSEERQAYWIRLKHDEGWGEGTIPPYYGVKIEDMESVWSRGAKNQAPFPDDPSDITSWIGEEGPAPARCALDIALHDRIARKQGVPLYQLLGIPYPEPKTSSFTIALDSPEAMAHMAKRVAQYPIIKIKLGGDRFDLDRLAAIRAVRPLAALWVDANAGWTFDKALSYLPDLEALKISMLEQPLNKDAIVELGRLQSSTQIPIVADESLQSFEIIEDLASVGVMGVNIKLMKVGGISPALKMIKRAKEVGLRVMLGCMIETAIGTTAMAHLNSFAEWLDLDASALITNDPFEGMTLDDACTVRISEGNGIGVKIKPNIEFP